MSLLPKKFFVTSGFGVSRVSPLGAFDAALKDAGISECNLVPVSSILPEEAVEIERCYIEPGSITFTVIARCDGTSGETVGAGICWVKGVDETGRRYGLVAEEYGNMDEEQIRQGLMKNIREMTELRGMRIEQGPKMEVKSGKVPEKMYGCAVAALVFIP